MYNTQLSFVEAQKKKFLAVRLFKKSIHRSCIIHSWASLRPKKKISRGATLQKKTIFKKQVRKHRDMQVKKKQNKKKTEK